MFKFRKHFSGKQIPNHHAKLMELLLFIPDLRGSFSPRKKFWKSYEASQCHSPQGGGYCDEPYTCSNDSMWRNGGTAPFVNLGTRWRSVVIGRFIRPPPTPSLTRKRAPINRRIQTGPVPEPFRTFRRRGKMCLPFW